MKKINAAALDSGFKYDDYANKFDYEYLFKREDRLPISSAFASGGTVLAPLPATIDASERRDRLEQIATQIRRSVVQMISRAKAGHIGGDLSATDSLATLFFSVLRVDPHLPYDPKRDRFILSKGHCAAALYSALACR